jgi:AI-2 transport protein TqsA
MKFESERSTDPINHVATLKVAVVIIAVIAAGFALWALRHILTPLALAAFLLVMVDGLAEKLRSPTSNFRNAVALPAALLAIVVAFVVSIWLLADNAAQFASQASGYADRLNRLLEEGAAQLGAPIPPTIDQLVHQLNPAQYAVIVARALGGVAEGAVFALIYLGFLLASRYGVAQKAVCVFPTASRRQEAQRILDRIRRGVESYVWVQTIVGLLIAGASALLMHLAGLSHVLFWAFVVFLANYIPALGAAIGVLFPALFGLLEFNDAWRAFLLLCGLEAVHFIVSHVVQPRMQGESLNVDPLVVLLSLALWGAIWGVAGAFLSTPIAVTAMAIFAEFKGTRPLAILLSKDGMPYSRRRTEGD